MINHCGFLTRLSDSSDGSEEMHIDGTLAESCGCGDLENVQIFDKPQKEDRPLFVGKISRGVPDRLNLLVDQGPLFGRDVSVGQATRR